MRNGKAIGVENLWEEIRISNRLNIVSLVRTGIAQKDVAATAGMSESALSKMFPDGLLKRVARLAKNPVDQN
jgi:hypothetical protein